MKGTKSGSTALPVKSQDKDLCPFRVFAKTLMINIFDPQAAILNPISTDIRNFLSNNTLGESMATLNPNCS